MKTVIRALLCYVTLWYAQHINTGNGTYTQISCKNKIAGALNNTVRREFVNEDSGTRPDFTSTRWINIQYTSTSFPSGSFANYAYSGSVNQATGNTRATANNLIIKNSAGTMLSVKAAGSGTQTSTSGNLNCSTNSLSVTKNADGAVARTSGHVIGNLQQAVANCTNTYHYPVGTATGYILSSFVLHRAGNGCGVT